MAKLTAARIRTLKTPGRHGDGDGLHLKISETGARSWILRVVIAGKRRDIGLGRYPDVGLAQAREAAAKHRSLIAAGADPIAEKRKAAIPTFREVAERTFEANKPRWRNGKHTISWWQSLEKHAFPIIGDMPVDQIDEEHVLRILTPIWGVRMETARRVRQRIRTVLKWAMAHKFVRHNVGGRDDRRRTATDAQSEEPPAGDALQPSQHAGTDRAGLPGVARGEVVSRVPDPDGCTQRRSARRTLVGNRHGRGHLDRPG